MEYFSVSVSTTKEAADIVSLILIEEGSEGVSVSDSDDLEFAKQNVYWDYAPEPLPDDSNQAEVLVTGFFDKNTDLSDLKTRINKLKNDSEFDTGSLKLTVLTIQSEDYENEWKKYYEVMEIGGIAIVPEWLSYNGDKPKLLMNPGKAFGTGGHETTSMCLELMQDFDLNNSVVFDVGCGSGILGLAALKLGAKKAYLTDIDIQAVEAATENAEKNGLLGKADIQLKNILASGGTDNNCEKADILLANLTADLLIRLNPLIDGMLKKGGKIVVSGIINSRADEVASAFSGFKLLKNVKNGEWQAFSFIKDI